VGSESAPVEVTMTRSSISIPGKVDASDPVAITMFFVSSTFSLPSVSVTTTVSFFAILAVPFTYSVLFFYD
jgi:hypothetical protein